MEWSGNMYVCSGGETFDSIARELWGEENYAAELMCANPEHCGKQAFGGGEELYVPVVNVPEANADGTPTEPAKAPWKE